MSQNYLAGTAHRGSLLLLTTSPKTETRIISDQPFLDRHLHLPPLKHFQSEDQRLSPHALISFHDTQHCILLFFTD